MVDNDGGQRRDEEEQQNLPPAPPEILPDAVVEEDEIEEEGVERPIEQTTTISESVHELQLRQANQELQKLLDDEWQVQVRNIIWKIVKASSPPEGQVESESHSGIGDREINFSHFGWLRQSLKNCFPPKLGEMRSGVTVSYDENLLPYLNLLQHLWPGNWKEHLRQLRKSIKQENESMKTNCSRSRRSNFKSHWLPTEKEFWVFVGILLVGSIEGSGGEELWSSDEKMQKAGVRGYFSYPNMGRYMPFVRFILLRRHWPDAFADFSKSVPNSPNYDP